MPISDSVYGALEVRRSDVEQAVQQAGGVFEQTFFITVTGNGNVTQAVNFGVRFVELPAVMIGWDMLPNQLLATGATPFYPTADAGVFTWKFGVRPDNGAKFYDGATLAITVNGSSNIVLRIHATFRGKAIRSPAG